MATPRQLSATLIREKTAYLRGIVVLVGIAGVPLIFLRFTNDPFNVPKVALLTMVVGVGGALLAIEMLQGYRPDGGRAIARPAIVFLTPLLLATLLSPYRGWAMFGEYQRFQGLIPYALAVGFGVLVATTFAGRAGDIAFWFAVAGGVAGGYAVAQYFGIDLFDWAKGFGGEAKVTSTLGNTNFIAGFLAMTLPVSASLWLEDRTDYFSMLFSVLILGGLVVSFSQGGWAAALGAGAVYLGFELRGRIPLARWLGVGAATLIAIVAAGAVIWGIVSPGSAPIAETVQLRSWWWEGAWDAGLDHPVLGHGPNSFAVDWWGNRPVEEASIQGFDTTNDPHSVYLSLFVGAGVIGVAGLLYAIGWAVVLAWNRSDRGSAAFLAAVVAYAIQGVAGVDEIALRVGLWTCFGGLVAAGLSAPTRPRKAKKEQASPMAVRSPVAVIASGVVALVVVVYGFVFIAADGAVEAGTDAFAGSDAQGLEESFSAALGMRGDFTYRRLYGFYAGSFASAAVDPALGEEFLQESRDAFSYLEGFPDVPGLRDRGRVLVENSESQPSLLEDAADSYAEAMAIDRYNLDLIPEGAAVLLKVERYEDLIRLLPRVMDALGRNRPTLWPMLGLAYEETGDLERAEAALERAETLAASDPNTVELQKRLGQGN